MAINGGPRKNILFICDFPFAGSGGVGRVTEILAEEFLRRGYNITYLAFCTGQEYVSDRIIQHFVPNPSRANGKENIQYVCKLIDELHIDIIINQAGAKIELINFFAKVKLDIPVLSVHHNCVKCLYDNYQHILTETFRNKKFFFLINNPLSWFFLKIYHRVKQGMLFSKAIHESNRLVLLSNIFVPEMKFYVPNFRNEKVVGLPNPASFPVVERVEEKKENKLIFVGRLCYQQKRVDLLLDLWKQIQLDFPDWHFDIVGDGPARCELERNAKAENLKRIHFHGFQDPRPYLEKAKFFCMTSAFEGFGMVLVEAQAYGVVPFAFDCFSALPDIIQSGVNGFIFPKFDLAQYTETLKQLMTDEESRKRLAKNSQASVAKYAPVCIIDRWENLFNEVAQNQKDSVTR